MVEFVFVEKESKIFFVMDLIGIFFNELLLIWSYKKEIECYNFFN